MRVRHARTYAVRSRMRARRARTSWLGDLFGLIWLVVYALLICALALVVTLMEPLTRIWGSRGQGHKVK